MSSLKELRERIKGVQSTQKITNAMRMVAAAKLKKSQYIIKNLQNFSSNFHSVTKKVVAQHDGGEITSPLLKRLEHGKHLLIVITSDRGLCGGFNSAILKAAQKFLHRRAKKDMEILAIGKRARDYFSKNLKVNRVELKSDTTFPAVPSLYNIRMIADELVGLVTENNLSEITVISAKFESVLTQVPQVLKIFPFECDASQEKEIEFICEPTIEKMIPDMIYHDFLIRLFAIFIENIASEHAARMTAMENASRNARDMIHDLKMKLNRSRQAKITTELMEIVSGAEALVGNV